MKKNIMMILSLFLCVYIHAKSYDVTIRITNITSFSGTIRVSINNTEESFNGRIPYKVIEIIPADKLMEYHTDLPAGEYAFCVFQDINNDKKLNKNILGFPKEPFGFSNYNGKDVPGNFKRHKILIEKPTVVQIPLIKF